MISVLCDFDILVEFQFDCQQTNTADMLDFAVDYIKDLQGEAKVSSQFSKP